MIDADGRDGAGFFIKQVNLFNLQKKSDELVMAVTQRGGHFVISEEMIKEFHRVCMRGLLADAGEYRKIPAHITGSAHIPPGFLDVPAHMRTFCDYVNNNWQIRDLVHLASFCLWRLNWIHPFSNGNGRTTRTISYLVLCAKFGQLFPARNTVIQQITEQKDAYNKSLSLADAIYSATSDVNSAVEPVEQLIGAMLTKQIQASL